MELWAIKRPNGFQPTGDLHIEQFEKLQNGQVYRLKVTKERSPGFHRKVMSMLRCAFDYWEPKAENLPEGVMVAKDFDRFRKDLTIAAGYYEVFWRLNDDFTEFTPEAKSIAFDNMEQTEFEELFNAYVDVIMNSPDIVPREAVQAKYFRDLIVSYL